MNKILLSKKGRNGKDMENIELEDKLQSGTETTQEPERLAWYMVILCYIVAFFLVGVMVYGFTGFIADVYNKVIEPKQNANRFNVLAVAGAFYLMGKLTINLGGFWRSNSKNEIGTAVTNFPNPFYDPSYSKGPLRLQVKYQEISSRYKVNRILLKRSEELINELKKTLGIFDSKIRVLLRHHDNTNRLIKSLNFLSKENNENFQSQMLGHILAECMTILEKDQSDKTITLFQVIGERLVIKDSVRINAESVAKRSFEKGTGFAGSIWSKGEAEIVNKIDRDDSRFKDGGLAATPIGSILGFPLKVEDDILGVLCLQSEAEDGFNEADLRAVEFYARMCTFILLYDKIEKKGGGV